jgi:hypothetical protein
VQPVRAEKGVSEAAHGSEAAGAASAAPAYALRERMLTPPQTLLYYLLRTALPDYLVFAHVPLSTIIEPGPALAGYARDEASRRLVARCVDFVVSDRRMRPVVAIELTAPAATTATAPSPAAWLASAGVRYIQLNAAALPRRHAVRQVVLGDAAAQGESRTDIASMAS